MKSFWQLFSSESIEFQSTNFFDELTDYYEKFNPDKPAYSELEGIIKKYTNITVEISDGGFWATSILMLGQNHVLFKDIFDQYKQFIEIDTETDLKNLLNKTKADVVKGYVDRQKSKVFGIFEKLKFTLWVNSKDINTTLTAKECAAVTLHEVGHEFTTFEMLGEQVYKNYALSNSLKAAGLDNSNPNKKVYLTRCAKDLNLNAEHSKKLSEAKDKNDVYLVALDEQRTSKSFTGSLNAAMQGNTYYSVNSEWAADDFATRQGAGEHVVTALHKMIDKSSSSRVAYNVMTILFTFVMPIFTGPAALFFIPLFFSMNIIQAIEDQKHKRYDFDAERFKRIKNTLILKIRTGDKQSKQQLKEILNSIDVIESSINKVSSEMPLMARLYSWIAGLVSKDMSLSDKQEQMQKGIEQMANNDLYLKAYKMQTL